MKLDTHVGLGPGHILLGGDRAPPPLRGHSPPIFGPCLLRPNGCMDQDVTWYGVRSRPRRYCVRWGSRSPSPKGGGGGVPPAKFSAHVYCGQTAGWMKLVLGIEVGLSPLPKRGGAPSPNFRPICIVAKRLHASKITWYGARARPRRLCVRWGPRSPSQKGGAEPPTKKVFFRPMFIAAKRLDG